MLGSWGLDCLVWLRTDTVFGSSGWELASMNWWAAGSVLKTWIAFAGLLYTTAC
jgi:hypothetical protein